MIVKNDLFFTFDIDAAIVKLCEYRFMHSICRELKRYSSQYANDQ